MNIYRLFGKRALDLLCAGIGLVILLPLLALLVVLVRWALGGPVFFRQQRPGFKGRPFMVTKFRSMTEALGADGKLLPDGARLTRFGRFLRKTSLDELPQLWNVFKGDMSLVGPRPLPMNYLPYFTETERVRFAVLPGITGWAQIHGRNEASWDERFARDVWYVENWGLWLDARILIRTVFQVLGSKGIVVDARSIMLNLDEERRHMVPGK